MVKVFITIDTEIWCDGWNDLDNKFPDAFRRYVYGGENKQGYALPITLQTLTDHGLTGTFFVEPLFALRFGIAPLTELVGLIQEAGHEVQMHMHTEWVDEAREPIFEDIKEKRQHLRYFTKQEQVELIRIGKQHLMEAGVANVSAFRAGSFAADRNTLSALKYNEIYIDTSYNAAASIELANYSLDKLLLQPQLLDEVYIYPVSYFYDWSRSSMRNLQVTACSMREFEFVLMHAVEAGWDSVNIVSHNFELLDSSRTKPDQIVIRRFRKLCEFLEKNNDLFQTSGFNAITPVSVEHQPTVPQSTKLNTGIRVAEQLARRFV